MISPAQQNASSPSLRVATLNLLNDLSDWERRGSLIRETFERLSPDLIAVQEVALPEDNATWLARQLQMECQMVPKTGRSSAIEGIAILSQLPVKDAAWLDLGAQDRVAQRVKVDWHGRPVVLANGHFYWHPGPVPEQTQQVERLLAWLDSLEIQENRAAVVAGDFNSLPDFPAVQRMRSRFQSAYAARHGQEPESTFPTPLKRPLKAKLAPILKFARQIRWRHFQPWLRGTLDYIFASPAWQVLDCQLIFDQPSPSDESLFASDHYGLFAELVFRSSIETDQPVNE